MLFIVGVIVVIASVLVGFAGGGGHLPVLWQPLELLIIFGAAAGAYLIANPTSVLLGAAKSATKLLTQSKIGKAHYLDLLAVMFSLFKLAKTKGDLALEAHVERPDESPLFQAYPSVAGNAQAVEFLCDYLRLLTLGTTNAHQLEVIMEGELEIHHGEKEAIAGSLSSVADGLPALGIVAAVLGVIHTMGSITEPPEIPGHLIGGALVGTFSGVLASYGVAAPIAHSLEKTFAAESRYLECIKTGIVAHMQGYAPQISVEFARKSIPGTLRPTFTEVEDKLQSVQI
ncbi:MAG TPA: flagellar motor stator protein MotA [Rhodospirillales bacterium]|nr:flagellar motor stator protein MotA [Rhodospirillales bacterium]